jgi:hypothetical protein
MIGVVGARQAEGEAAAWSDHCSGLPPQSGIPINDNMGMAWTRSGNVSKSRTVMDTSREQVHRVDL